MDQKLVIVESPTKMKTLKKILGKGRILTLKKLFLPLNFSRRTAWVRMALENTLSVVRLLAASATPTTWSNQVPPKKRKISKNGYK